MYMADGQPEDRLGRVIEAWQRAVEPVGLTESTIPVLAGAASPTLRRYVDGKPSVSRSRALALMRLPESCCVDGGLPERHLSAVVMVGETSPFSFSSHIASLVPRGLFDVLPDRHLDVRVEDDAVATRHRVAVRADAEGWMSETLEVDNLPEAGADARVVLIWCRVGTSEGDDTSSGRGHH